MTWSQRAERPTSSEEDLHKLLIKLGLSEQDMQKQYRKFLNGLRVRADVTHIDRTKSLAARATQD